jgi:hypothetical protein
MSKQTARQNELLIEYKYGKTHHIKKMWGTEVNLKNLEPNESVVMGDGKTYYWKLTTK